MKTSFSVSFSAAAALVILLLCVPQLQRQKRREEICIGKSYEKRKQKRQACQGQGSEDKTMEIAAGSGLPDCSHACGSCSPCRLVMVRFLCASLQEAETCPMAYKCMCHKKSYPVT
ncbi:hypothetical protein L6164_022323 [Bauhinia variegata]|uniref:Uncharacterized protein n=1 Tax=Bauhinia variegata TaxID=167791 RepID=A0ACB9MFT8_BAUVA|nr:hypothetical protein L6164_022323 [Bauhinia variegata]